jgi:hypothetical protein
MRDAGIQAPAKEGTTSHRWQCFASLGILRREKNRVSFRYHTPSLTSELAQDLP